MGNPRAEETKVRLLLVLALAILLALARSLLPLPAAAEIVGSVHDFTETTGPQSEFRGAEDPCSTCHAPHTESDNAVIWNHTLSSTQFTFGREATFAGTELPRDIGSSPGTSKYCLSCHDGTVAVGDFMNGSAQDWGTTSITDPGMIIGGSGKLTGTHPVGVPYPDAPGAAYNRIVSAADPVKFVADPEGVELYGSGTGSRGIECGSCHDVHNKNPRNFLLREGFSCLSCHLR